MKKLLYILNVAKKVNNFSYTSMIAAQESGIEFHIAGNWSYSSDDERIADEKRYGIKIHQIDFIRTPYHPENSKAYIQLKELIRSESYDMIHCNTPIGGILGRLAGKSCGVKRVLYQAHGFHFYKGAPKLNWLLFYPVEKLLARLTDALVTINKEDYELAKSKMKLRNGGRVYYIPGVGIDAASYGIDKEKRQDKRKELGFDESDIVLVSLGDLIERKNYKTAIRAVAAADNKNLKYIICGKGPDEESLKSLAKELGVESQVFFLGFRTDVKDLLGAADIFLFTTKQEGLARSMMEAMATGLPCVVSDIRGNTDLLDGGEKGGFLCGAEDENAFAEKISLLAVNEKLREEMGLYNLEKIKEFSLETVENKMLEIYLAEFGE